MLRWLPLVLLSLSAVLVLSSSATPGQALGDPFACHAKNGTIRNKGKHPTSSVLLTQDWAYSLAAPGTQPRTISFGGAPPFPVVTTTLNPDSTFQGTAAGPYEGFDTTWSASGSVTFYDEAQTQPQILSVVWEAGTDGALPGEPGEDTVEFGSECVSSPTQEIEDPDGDGVPGVIHALTTVSVSATAELAPGQNNIIVRTPTDQIQQITLADPSQFKISFDRQGPLEAIVNRRHNRVLLDFVGTWGPGSEGTIDLPPELSDAETTFPVTGVYNGHAVLDGHGDSVLQSALRFRTTGQPFNILGGVQDSGTWALTNGDPSPTGTSIDPITGAFQLQGNSALFAEDIAVSPGSVPQFGDIGQPGDPLIFTETTTGGFPLPAILAVIDNCPDIANPDQADGDGDGIGDVCDGVIWFDGDCSGGLTGNDVIYSLYAAAGDPLPAAPGCLQFGDAIGGQTFGDWNCDGSRNTGDVLAWLRRFGGIDAAVPAGCPAPETYVLEG